MLDRLETKVPPVVWAAAAMLVVIGLSVVLNGEFGADSGRPRLAAALAALGVIVAISAVSGFGRAKTTIDPHTVGKASTLVTSGPYRFTRNPMYLGLLCLVVAVGLWGGNLFAVVVGGTLFVLIMNRLQIIPEERYLAQRFGAPYRKFTSSVRRWV